MAQDRVFKLSLELEVLLGGYFVDTSSALVRFFVLPQLTIYRVESREKHSDPLKLSVASSGAEEGKVSTRTRR